MYLRPLRNGYGIIGPIPAAELAGSPITNAIQQLGYDARIATGRLSRRVPRVHFDEALFASAHPHPIYHDRCAMNEDPEPGGPTLDATHSTHKLLAAFSQSVDGPYPACRACRLSSARGSTAYLMHGLSSPF